MGHTEDARILLAKGKRNHDALALAEAQVNATLALIEALGGLENQMDYLTDLVREQGTPSPR